MWTKFQIHSIYYTSVQRHYQIYFECDEDTALHIFRHQSRVFQEYYVVDKNNKPLIENVDFYRLKGDEYVYIYNKDYIKNYLLKHPINR